MDTGIILVGPPCCGKSTIGMRVAHDFGIEYISSGDIAREMAINNSSIRVSLDNGMMAPEYEMRMNVLNRVNNRRGSALVLDGFPRTVDQMCFIEKHTKNIRWSIIMFTADKDQLIERAKCRGRSDDNSFNHRYDFYCSHTMDLINYAIENNHDVCVIDNSNGKYDEAIRETINFFEREM